MGKSQLEEAREKYRNISPVVNNMDGDGTVTLLERLGGAEND
jgi:hypothetical protein